MIKENEWELRTKCLELAVSVQLKYPDILYSRTAEDMYKWVKYND